jgi:hypothetical protein
MQQVIVPLSYRFHMMAGLRGGTPATCEAAGVVYDPILPRPLPTEDYLPAAFEQAVVVEDYSDILHR